MSPLNNRDLHQIFEGLDQNGDGLLSVEELNWLLEKIGVHLSLDELESLVGKSSVKFDEFLSFYNSITMQSDDKREMLEKKGNAEEIDLVEVFNTFDLNGDGFISCKELQNVLSRLGLWDENGKDCKSMISKYDTNFDGMVDFEEFKNMMLHNAS